MERTISLKWKKSVKGRPGVQKKTIQGLGLRRLNQVVTLPDQPQIRGMIQRVKHLVEVVE